MDIAFQSARKLASLIRHKKIGCVELLDHFLARIERYNPRINAIITTGLDAAHKRAKLADRAAKKGEWRGPLHGVPMTIKESFDAIGMPTTWGLTQFKDNFPKRNAAALDRLLEAGAVLIGKTNVPVLLADWQSFNPIYGTTNNPWDVTRTPGGSSGGAAAALAAGLCALETGSDIGASIRNPAHYCGVYGHKPTFGIAATSGHRLPDSVSTSDIAAIGPLARSADDIALALKIIAGPDDIDARGWRLALPPPRKRQLKDFKVAVMTSHPTAEVDEEVQAPLRALAEFLAKKKAKVNDRARPAFDPDAAHRVYIQVLRAATSKRIAPAVFAQQLASREDFDAADTGYYAQMVRANTMSHKEWLDWHEQRERMRYAWDEFFRDYDLLLCPTAATAAFAHDQQGERWERMLKVNGKAQPTTTQLFWAGYSGMAYLPSTVAPIGLTRSGLPVGVQIVGPQYGDYTCIEFAKLLGREYYAFAAPAARGDPQGRA
jgi:amidase